MINLSATSCTATTQTRDHWEQGSTTAKCKRLYGEHLVYPDGVTVDEEKTPRTGDPMMSASARGRRAVALHCLSLGLARSASPRDTVFAQLSGMRWWAMGARQVSQNEAVAA
ncbi:hypothetical protein ACFTUC_38780 [Streptomyces sp. NPDC056944]|uniref:hypothetical protein n=1 Tax=unclassified Streptomyces TaxID=2593676 RepID=UPI00362CA41A